MGRFGYAGIFVLTAVSSATLMLAGPGEMGALLAAARRAPLPLGLMAGLGAAAGELTKLPVGATSIHVLPAPWQQRLVLLQQSRRYAQVQWCSFVTLLVLTAVPNPLFGLIGLACGADRMPVWKYFLPVFLGNCLRILIIA